MFVKNKVRAARTHALRTVNTQLIELYWSIGNDVRAAGAASSGDWPETCVPTFLR